MKGNILIGLFIIFSLLYVLYLILSIPKYNAHICIKKLMELNKENLKNNSYLIMCNGKLKNISIKSSVCGLKDVDSDMFISQIYRYLKNNSIDNFSYSNCSIIYQNGSICGGSKNFTITCNLGYVLTEEGVKNYTIYLYGDY